MPEGAIARIVAHALMDAIPFPKPLRIGMIYVIIIAYQKNDWKPFYDHFSKNPGFFAAIGPVFGDRASSSPHNDPACPIGFRERR